MTTPTPGMLLVSFVVAGVAGAINAVAGGGTLLSFPSLMALGLDDKVANMTSTVGLWPGSLGGAWSFRREIAQGGKVARMFYVMSFLGGALGAWLLLATDTKTFAFLVPWLILGATVLFMLQAPLSRWLSARSVNDTAPMGWSLWLPIQFLIGVYGGYFGAGIGILMLAGLGLLGFEDIYQRNGIKNIAAVCINGIAIVFFATAAQVEWSIAGVMAAGALIGGYLCAGWAKRIGPVWARRFVVLVGLSAGGWKLVELWYGGFGG